MRSELPGTYTKQENGNMLVLARSRALEEIQYFVNRDELILNVQGREIELRPVISKVTLFQPAPEMERVMAAAAKGCYSGLSAAEIFPKLTTEQARSFLKEEIIQCGHLGVLEHGSFTFCIEGVSRALTHQLVRHRIASYLQQSQRYNNPVAERIKKPVFKFIVPPSIRCSEDRFRDYVKGMKEGLRSYVSSIKSGIKEEDARMFLANAAVSNITMTVNARSLYEIGTQRTCALAQWEIDILLTQMLLIAYDYIPSAFETAGPECSRTRCPEGKRSCGNPIQSLIKYRNDEIYPHDHLIFETKKI